MWRVRGCGLGGKLVSRGKGGEGHVFELNQHRAATDIETCLL